MRNKSDIFDLVSIALLLVLVVIMTSCSFSGTRREKDRVENKQCTIDLYREGIDSVQSWKICRDINIQ